MHFNKGELTPGRQFDNGLCLYQLDEKNDEMALVN